MSSGGRFSRGFILMVGLGLTGVSCAVAQLDSLADSNTLAETNAVVSDRITLGRPGYVVIEGVRDTTAEFSWQQGPGPGRHSLVWSVGTLSLPDSVYLDEFGESDAGVICAAELSGVGGSGRLVFEDGVYLISEPLVLSDGILELHLSGGELEVRGDQIRYRRARIVDTEARANYIFLAGLVLLIIVLMRRARMQMRK